MIQTPKAAVAEMGSDNAGQWIVNLDMTKEGRKKWSKFTGENINRQVAIILDDKVFMAPFIRDKISSGGTQISGFADMQEAKDIASVLKAGELPAPIKIIQTNYVGPSLGQDSINSGSFSMIIGLALVLIFMLLYYKASGIIANIALVINIIIIFAVLYTMNAVLTLPGIAGLLLTVGMSVDANVIIFERIKEEIKSGKTIYASVNNGYKKAFVTILDANITTLLTAFILSFIGSGPIKGFATTLSVGIFCSMFTAVFFTKTLFLTLLKKTTINKLSI
jgi:protein-export membrane protein SecD